MRFLQLTFIIAISFLIGCSTSEKNDWEVDELQGRVQSYSQFLYKAEERFGNIKKVMVIKIIKLYTTRMGIRSRKPAIV